jgi:hypothetical protein
MRTPTLTLALVYFTLLGAAYSTPEGGGDSAMRDADYALRRFEAVAARIDLGQWQTPPSIVKKELEARRMAKHSAKEAREIIAKFSASRKLSPAELVDIISDLGDIGTELSGLSGTLRQDWGSPDPAKLSGANALAQDVDEIGTDTYRAEAELLAVLKSEVLIEELRLKTFQITCPPEKKPQNPGSQ